MDRKQFIQYSSLLAVGACLPGWATAKQGDLSLPGKLRPIGRALEMEGYYVWCSCPIDGPDGKVHLFFSRWAANKKMGGWLNGSEIAHAVADKPEGPYRYVSTVLSPRGGDHWDATTCHNPLVCEVNGMYYLFYMGNANGKTNTKRIGLAVSDSLFGPWTRPDQPLLLPGPAGSWDDHCTTNPAFVVQADGKYGLYYKSWNTAAYEAATGGIKGNRKYGLAIADAPEGPYRKYEGNPVIDFSHLGNNKQLEDAFVWNQGAQLRMIARDMGFYNQENGLLMASADGLNWSDPAIAYRSLDQYVSLPVAPAHLKKYGRLERPMLLIRKGRPAYLFGATQGGQYMTSSTFIFKIA